MGSNSCAKAEAGSPWLPTGSICMRAGAEATAGARCHLLWRRCTRLVTAEPAITASLVGICIACTEPVKAVLFDDGALNWIGRACRTIGVAARDQGSNTTRVHAHTHTRTYAHHSRARTHAHAHIHTPLACTHTLTCGQTHKQAAAPPCSTIVLGASMKKRPSYL